MAVNLQTAKQFRISRSLFRREDGSPIAFYAHSAPDDLKEIVQFTASFQPPCLMPTIGLPQPDQLFVYISNKGGGYITDNVADATIMLCEKKTDNSITSGYLPFDFVVDCVKRNSFLNVNKYRSEILGLQASTSHKEESSDSEDEEIPLKSRESSRIRLKATDLSGRRKYTDVDDFKMIKYLINHERYHETGGNIVWKDMESVKVTDHTHQSMKARFKKKILPELDSYDIPAEWRTKLLKSGGENGHDSNTSSKSSRQSVLSFDQIEKWKAKEWQMQNERKNKDNVDVVDSVSNHDSSSSPKRAHRVKKGRIGCTNISPVQASTHNTTTPQNSYQNSIQKVILDRSENPGTSAQNSNAHSLKDNFMQILNSELSDTVNSVNIDNGRDHVSGGEDPSLSVTTDALTDDDSCDEMDRLILSEANRAETASRKSGLSSESDIAKRSVKRTRRQNTDETSDSSPEKNHPNKPSRSKKCPKASATEESSKSKNSLIKKASLSSGAANKESSSPERQPVNKLLRLENQSSSSKALPAAPKSRRGQILGGDLRSSTQGKTQEQKDDHSEQGNGSASSSPSQHVEMADYRQQSGSTSRNSGIAGKHVDVSVTRKRVQFLCDMYGLEEKEAIHVLMYHEGNFHATMKFLDS